MKILTAEQTRKLDAFTIAQESIESVDLMERASSKIVCWLMDYYPQNMPFHLFCGMGNNGGDGLAIARMLHQAGYEVYAHIVRFSEKGSKDFRVNEQRLPPTLSGIGEIKSKADFPKILENAILVDAIFGSGLARPLSGFVAELISYLNRHPNEKVAVDIASGLYSNQPNESTDVVFAPTRTLSFQLPKLAFMMPENEAFVHEWELLDIGLSQDFIEKESSDFFYTDTKKAASLLMAQKKFSHKGTFGHALLMGGSYGKIGAIVLATKAALRTGAGLATVYVPRIGYPILQTALPEAMCLTDDQEKYLSKAPTIDQFDAIGVGPGLDTSENPLQALEELLEKVTKPLVIDADAINLIGKHPELLEKVPKNSLFTPHPKEFERLAGKVANHYERLEKARSFSKEHGVVLVIKGAHTAVVLPDGTVHFNSTGNPGMATGGSGDVLTGIITALLAQGYRSEDAAILGVYLHGLAGDHAAKTTNARSIIVSDLIENIGKAFNEVEKSKMPLARPSSGKK